MTKTQENAAKILECIKNYKDHPEYYVSKWDNPENIKILNDIVLGKCKLANGGAVTDALSLNCVPSAYQPIYEEKVKVFLDGKQLKINLKKAKELGLVEEIN